jgi:uncharacterized protein
MSSRIADAVPIASRGGLTGGASAMNLSIRQFLHPWKPRHGPRRRRSPWTRRPLSTFAGLVMPFGSVIGPLAVWLSRRDRDPFINQAGREALNFGISIAIYGVVALVAALMLVGIPLVIVGVIAWVVLASLAAAKASQGRSYRRPQLNLTRPDSPESSPNLTWLDPTGP